MSPHDHNVAFDRPSAMDCQYYDADYYYDAPLPASTNYDCSQYQNSYTYFPGDMMLAVPDPQGEQQLIQTPVREYPQGGTSASISIHSVSPELSSVASADFHDAGACSSIPPYYSERRPSYPPRWVQELTNPHQSSEYRATIARLSNDFLANASSLFGGSPSRARSAPTTSTGPAASRSSPVRTDDFIPTRKRSLEVMSEETFIEQQLGAHANAAPTEDPIFLPQPHMIVPSQNNVAQERRGSLHGGESRDPLRSSPHPVRLSVSSPDSLLLRDEGRSVSHQPNKRPHRSEEIIRHSHTTPGPATWTAPGDPVMKTSAPRKTGEQKKQALACLFCRERKIACGRPSAHSPDQTCNQCARRRMKCEYPTESRRGQHKRIRRKPIEENGGASSASSTTLQSVPNTPPVVASVT